MILLDESVTTQIIPMMILRTSIIKVLLFLKILHHCLREKFKGNNYSTFCPDFDITNFRTWVDNLPFEIPFGFATTFKSDEDWLDEWEELDEEPTRKRKPYTFDDRVDDYRRGIKKALEITEKKEEKDEEVDLVFAEVVDESGKAVSEDFSQGKFTPMCTPKKNRKELLGKSFSIIVRNVLHFQL